MEGFGNDEILTPEQVCEYLQISRTTLWKRRIEDGLPAIPIGQLVRFRRSDVDRWLRDQMRDQKSQMAV